MQVLTSRKLDNPLPPSTLPVWWKTKTSGSSLTVSSHFLCVPWVIVWLNRSLVVPGIYVSERTTIEKDE
jgi:hypothetical protein